MGKFDVIQRLHEKVSDIVFEKADGTLRKMRATLREELLPQAQKEDLLSQKKVRTISPDVCVIWDYESKDWRSFRWDRLKQVDGEVYNGEK